jgi:hypothetical protein
MERKMESEKKHLLPVQYSEEGGWSLAPKDLNDHLKAHFDDLRQHALNARDISKKRIGIVVSLVIGMTTIICVMALSGATIWAFLLALFSFMELKPLLAFAEKDAKIKAIEVEYVKGPGAGADTDWEKFKERA